MLAILDTSDNIFWQEKGKLKKLAGKFPPIAQFLNGKLDFKRMMTQKGENSDANRKLATYSEHRNLKSLENKMLEITKPNFETPDTIAKNLGPLVHDCKIELFQSTRKLERLSKNSLKEVVDNIEKSLQNFNLTLPISQKENLAKEIESKRVELHNSTNHNKQVKLKQELEDLQERQNKLYDMKDETLKLNLNYEMEINEGCIDLKVCSFANLEVSNEKGEVVESIPFLLNKDILVTQIESGLKQEIGIKELHKKNIKDNVRDSGLDYTEENIINEVFDYLNKDTNKERQQNGKPPVQRETTIPTTETNEEEDVEVNEGTSIETTSEETVPSTETTDTVMEEETSIDTSVLDNNKFLKKEGDKPRLKDKFKVGLDDSFIDDMYIDLTINEESQKRVENESSSKIKELQKQIEEEKKKYVETQALKNQNDNTKILLEQYTVLKSQNEEINVKNGKLEDVIKDLEVQIGGLENLNETLESKYSEAETKIETQYSEIVSLTEDKEKLENENESLTINLDLSDKEVERLSTENDGLKTSNKSMEDRIKELEQQLVDRENTITRLENDNKLLNENVENLTSTLSNTENLLKEVKEELSKSNKTIEEISSKREEEKELFKETLNGIKEMNELLKTQNQELKESNDTFKQSIEEFKTSINGLKVDNRSLSKDKSDLENQVEVLEEENSKMVQDKKEGEKYKTKSEVLEEEVKKLREENSLLKKRIPQQQSINKAKDTISQKVEKSKRDNNLSEYAKSIVKENELNYYEDDESPSRK